MTQSVELHNLATAPVLLAIWCVRQMLPALSGPERAIADEVCALAERRESLEDRSALDQEVVAMNERVHEAYRNGMAPNTARALAGLVPCYWYGEQRIVERSLCNLRGIATSASWVIAGYGGEGYAHEVCAVFRPITEEMAAKCADVQRTFHDHAAKTFGIDLFYPRSKPQ